MRRIVMALVAAGIFTAGMAGVAAAADGVPVPLDPGSVRITDDVN